MHLQNETMKRIFILLLLLPALVVAQKTPKAKAKPTTKTKTKVAVTPVVINDGFTINGEIKGFADGTPVSLLNGQTGAPEAETTINKEKFTFKGKLNSPDFRILLFNKKPPYLTVFLDNSTVTVTGTKEALDKISITGSKTHDDFMVLSNLLVPYQNLFAENAVYDSAAISQAMLTTSKFATEHADSYIAPFAIYRFNQIAADVTKTEALFTGLTPEVKYSQMGMAVAQVIATAKKNALGYVLPDFTQADTSGTPIALSSLRGKFVLIDFWASWCRPCRQENPNVVNVFQKFKDKNFTVLGVSLDRSKPAWIEAINADGLTWTHVSDLQFWNNAVAQQFQIQSIPANYLIDPEGKVVGRDLRGPALEMKLASLLK